MCPTIEFLVTNSPVAGSKELAVEFWHAGEELAWLDEHAELTIWPRNDGQPWKINLNDFVQALMDAKERLRLRGT